MLQTLTRVHFLEVANLGRKNCRDDPQLANIVSIITVKYDNCTITTLPQAYLVPWPSFKLACCLQFQMFQRSCGQFETSHISYTYLKGCHTSHSHLKWDTLVSDKVEKFENCYEGTTKSRRTLKIPNAHNFSHAHIISLCPSSDVYTHTFPH